MKKNMIIVLGAIAVIAAVIVLAGMYKFAYRLDDICVETKSGEVIKRNDYEQNYIDLAKNGTYSIDGESVTLQDGVSQIAPYPDSAARVTTRYINQYMIGDINGDESEDIATFISRETGGSGTFYYVVAQLSSPNGYSGSKAIFVGDRIKPKEIFWNGANPVASYFARAEGEPMAKKTTNNIWMDISVENNELKVGDTKAAQE